MSAFADLGLGPSILRAVAESGYTQPTPIQERAIPVVLTGRDMLGSAQTGTGKTASFVLPMIEILSAGRSKARMPRSLILEPTRELAAQVADSFDRYGKYHKLSKALLIGGESMADQIKVLDRGADVLIATPGRLLDVFGRGHLVMSDIRILVIDEADRMLDMGFIPDVERIVSLVARKRQTLLFSATMPPEIRRLADAFLDNPKEIAVSPPATPAETVEQGLVIVADAGRESHRVKRAALRRLIDTQEAVNALIFCNRKRDVGVLQRSLHRHGYDAAMLHGDMPQPARTEVLGRFRRGEVAFLVCSDVAARGLDIAGIDCVFNFDVPINAEDYIHRIGRTGRAGRPGRAFTLATPGDGPYVAGIEHLIGKTLPRITVDGIADAELEAGSRRGHRRGRGRATAEASPKRAVAAPSAPRPAPARAESPPRTEPRSRAEPPPRTEPRSRTESRRRREPAAPDVPVVGMGDHVPAFLLREAKVPPAKRTVETDVDENAP